MANKLTPNELADLELWQVLDLARANHHLPSDAQLASKIGVHRSAMTDYRDGRRVPSDKAAVELARLADIDPLVLLAKLQGFRAASSGNDPYPWQKMVERLCGFPGALALALLLTHPSFSPAPQALLAPHAVTEAANTLYIMD